MQTKMDEKGELYRVDVTESQNVVVETTFATTSFKIVFHHADDQETVVQKFLGKLEKKGKLGDLKIPRDEWLARKQDFIAKRMKPMIAKPNGDEYEGSFKSLFAKIFPNG